MALTRRRLFALVIVVAAGGLALWTVRSRPPEPATQPVAAPARAAAVSELSGRVIDGSGRPIGGVLLRARNSGGAVLTASSEDDGAFRFEVRAGTFQLVAEAAGYENAQLDGVAAPARDLTVMLVRRRLLAGVTRQDGRPRGDVELRLAGATIEKTRSAPDGTFSFPALAEGRYTLEARASGSSAVLEDVKVPTAEVMVVELAGEQRLSGVVKDEAGKPILGALVEAGLVSAPSLLQVTRTGESGEYVLAGLATARYVVRVSADSFLPSLPTEVKMKGGKPVRQTWKLVRGATIEGRVLDESGAPVRHASIAVAGDGEGGPIVASSSSRQLGLSIGLEPAGELGILRGAIPYPPARPLPRPASDGDPFSSDENGHFLVGGLGPGRVVVSASHPALAAASSSPLELRAGGRASVELRLSRGVTVKGRVRDRDGRPLGQVDLATSDGQRVTRSDARGNYLLEHVAASASITARHLGHRPETATLPAGGSERTLDFALVPASGRIAGSISDERGGPVAGARVRAEAMGQASADALRETVTDRAGRFQLDGLAEGAVRVTVSHSTLSARSFDVSVPSDDLRWTLSAGGTIEGDARDERSGVVPAGLKVELEAADGAHGVTVVRGRFLASGVAAGSVTVRASAPGYVRWQKEVEVEVDRRIELRVDLQRGGVVFGSLRAVNGDLAAGVEVRCAHERTRTDGKGEFRLSGIEPGRHPLEAGGQPLEEVDVRANDDTHVDLRLPL